MGRNPGSRNLPNVVDGSATHKDLNMLSNGGEFLMAFLSSCCA